MKYLLNELQAKRISDALNANYATPSNKNRILPTLNIAPFEFKLTGNLSGGTANAKIYHLDDTTGYIKSTEIVRDRLGLWSRAITGYKGLCILWNNKYYVIECQLPCAMYWGLASTSYVAHTVSVVIDGLQAMDNGVATTLTTLTVNNLFGWELLDNGVCLIAWDKTNDKWQLIQTSCT